MSQLSTLPCTYSCGTLLPQPNEKWPVTSCLKTFESGLGKFLGDRRAKARSGLLAVHLHLGVGLKFSAEEKPLQFHLEKGFHPHIWLPTLAGRIDWERALFKTNPWTITERSQLEDTKQKIKERGTRRDLSTHTQGDRLFMYSQKLPTVGIFLWSSA